MFVLSKMKSKLSSTLSLLKSPKSNLFPRQCWKKEGKRKTMTFVFSFICAPQNMGKNIARKLNVTKVHISENLVTKVCIDSRSKILVLLEMSGSRVTQM